ncbi:MAG: nucleotidyl transferase AbiEii/AbiGii toxin family protein [Gemmatimonadales bacterium]
MPLTEHQRRILSVLATGRQPERYLAGGAAIHFSPNSTRYSDDLDFFHDSEARVAATFAADRAVLEAAGFEVEVEISQPGLIRSTVRLDGVSTKVDWAHDTAWRFMPLVTDELGGLLLHDVDLAVNKVLALAGRNEPRDYVDMLYLHERVLSLGALIWAACGKDPGFTPLSLLELLKRRGRYRPEDIERLQLTQPFDLVHAKGVWLEALEEAEQFVRGRAPEELGCLYYATAEGRFITPTSAIDLAAPGVVCHFGAPGGVIPTVR